MQIHGLSHVRLSVQDLGTAIWFYCKGLGLRLLRQSEEEAVIATPDGILLFISAGGTDEWDASGITHVCYNTWNVDAAFQRALAFGAVPSRESDPEPYTYKDLRMAFVRTATGEEIEFWGVLRPSGQFGEPMPGDCYVKNFVHVAVTVSDMPASARFYETLGATLKVDWEWGCSLRLPDRREMELFTGGQYTENPKAYTSFGFLAAAPQKPLLGVAGEVIEFLTLPGDDKAASAFASAPEELPDLFAEVEQP